MFVAGRLYEQEHIYIYIYIYTYTCKCFKLIWPLFRVIMVVTKKRPNDNLKHLHIYVCSCSYSLPATNMMACLTTKYISPCSYQSTWPQPDISPWPYTNLLGRHLISVLGLTNLFNHRPSPCSY